MARIKLGAMIADIRGKLQNAVYSLAKGGVHYVKNIPASVLNPNSIDQGAARARLMEAAADWSSLTPGEQAAWAAVAVRCGALSKENPSGIEHLVPAIGFDGSGFNAYVAFRTRSRLSGVSLADFNTAWRLGVATETQPTAPTITAVAFLAGTVTVDYTDPIASDVAAKIAMWAGSREKVYHPQIKGYDALGVLSWPFSTLKAAKGIVIPFTETTGGILMCQLQTINPSGWASPGSNTMEAVIA
jgi:hypothetical protein